MIPNRNRRRNDPQSDRCVSVGMRRRHPVRVTLLMYTIVYLAAPWMSWRSWHTWTKCLKSWGLVQVRHWRSWAHLALLGFSRGFDTRRHVTQAPADVLCGTLDNSAQRDAAHGACRLLCQHRFRRWHFRALSVFPPVQHRPDERVPHEPLVAREQHRHRRERHQEPLQFGR
jgi:hypothetical protein